MGAMYDVDVLEWSEHQARLLRQHAEGRPSNEPIDWANIIEEVESVGRSQLSAVRSLLVHALLHDLKCTAWPLSPEVPHWEAEAVGFRGEAEEAFTASMRQRIDIADLYRRALKRMPRTIDGQLPQPVPLVCPVTLDALLAEGSEQAP